VDVKDQEDPTENVGNQVCQEIVVPQERKEKLDQLDLPVKTAVMDSMVNVETQDKLVLSVLVDHKENRDHQVSMVQLVTKV